MAAQHRLMNFACKATQSHGLHSARITYCLGCSSLFVRNLVTLWFDADGADDRQLLADFWFDRLCTGNQT